MSEIHYANFHKYGIDLRSRRISLHWKKGSPVKPAGQEHTGT